MRPDTTLLGVAALIYASENDFGHYEFRNALPDYCLLPLPKHDFRGLKNLLFLHCAVWHKNCVSWSSLTSSMEVSKWLR